MRFWLKAFLLVLIVSNSACTYKIRTPSFITSALGANPLQWLQTSPYNSTSVTAKWIKSTAANLSNQHIQFYSDAGCSAPSGTIIDLSSNTLETLAFSGTDGITYSYKITSYESDGDSKISGCSTSMAIDTSAPATAGVPTWVQTSPHNSTSVTATWTKSISTDLINQTIQFYSDGTCTTPTGSLVDLASASATTASFTGVDGSDYAFIVSSLDAAGNSTPSACSTLMVIDTSGPSATTALGWVEASPSTVTAVTASWTKSNSADLANQKIQFYSDASCGSTSGALIDLASTSTVTRAFTGVDGNTYTYNVTSIDASGNSTVSACSSSMVIDASPPNGATALSWVEASPSSSTSVTASWSKSTSTDLANQKIQFYGDGTCTAVSGGLIDLASDTAVTQAFTGVNGNTYTYKVTSFDAGGSFTVSGCSTSMVIDTTPPNTATVLTWVQASPFNSTAVTASWTKSTSLDLSNQKIQFFSDGICSATSGSLIDLASAATVTRAFTGANASTYTYKITSFDGAGNSTISACSSSMTIDTTAPIAATVLTWAETSPSSVTGVTANWNKSVSADLFNQKIQFYADGICSAVSGGLIDLASAALQVRAFTGANGTTYTYKITSLDAAGNSAVSGCSSSMLIDTSAPNAASALSWVQTSPSSATSVTASWTKSNSADLSNQKIQFFVDGTCTAPSGGLIDLASTSTVTRAFTGVNGSTYTYQVTSFDPAGNQTLSLCSSAMVIDTTPPIEATAMSWVQASPFNATAVTASWTKSTSPDLTNQKIQFYSDGTCSVTSGSLIDLASAATITRAFTGTNGTTYTYIITSFDGAGNSTPSLCSSPMLIDTTAPNATTALGWIESSPFNGTGVTASWTKSNSADLFNQKIQFYVDGTCGVLSGGLIDLGSASLQTRAFTGVNGSTYTYKLTSLDAAGNSTVSGCSSSMLINTAAPSAATALTWVQTSPFNATGVTASWTKSNDVGLTNQQIQFYSDGTCTVTSGSLIDLASNSVQTRAFTGVNGSTYTYKVTSIEPGGPTVSACSSSMVIDTTAPNTATVLSWVQTSPSASTSVTASWTKSNSADLFNQKIQFYGDGTCTAVSGGLIDLTSASTVTRAFSGANGSTYTYKVTSLDAAGNLTVSGCSSSMLIDTAAPNTATVLSWVQASPFNSTAVTASWTKSNSGDLFNQKIQFYSDAICSATSGSLIDLGSASTVTSAFTGVNGSTYTYKVTSLDAAGNSTLSACSSSMLIDTTAPNAATVLGWVQTSPYNATAVTASWTKSNSADLFNQKIQFYADGVCSSTSGGLIDLASAATVTRAFTGANGTTYTYRLTSLDAAGNSTTSACSSTMVIDTTGPNAATVLSWVQTSPYNATAVTASWTKSNSGDLSNQKIQFYVDGTCTAVSGALIDLASTSTITRAFTGANGSTYSYILTSFDAAGNTTASACSSSMVIDTTAPNAATLLGWVQTSPYNATAVTASWTKSNSGDLFNQKIQFYSDGTCTVTSGSLIDLASAATVTRAFTGANGTTYTYKITSLDAAGNTTASACSSSMLIDTTAPNAATALGWVQTSPSGVTGVTASWTKSNSVELSNQKIQFYADGICSTVSGVLIDLASTSTITRAFTGTNGTTYTYKISSLDAAGNIGLSACSSSMVIDTSAPNAATSLTWVQSSPSSSGSVTASWTKSNSSDLSNQKIQFYSDGTCTGTTGSLIDLASSSTVTRAFSGTNGSTYTYKITSFDGAGNSTLSGCSLAMTITFVPLYLTPANFTYPVGQTLSLTFAGSGGSGSGYTYVVLSGVGSIGTASVGDYTGGTSRFPGTTSVIRVTDSNGTTATTTITHGGISVGGYVRAIASDASSVYIGGSFNNISPYVATGFTSVNTTSGNISDYGISSAFNAGAVVKAVVVSSGYAYVGGTFTKYKGVTVQNLVKINLTTGLLDTTFSQTTGPNGEVKALAISGTSLYVGGNFTTYRTDPKGYYLAKVDTTSGNMDTAAFNTAASSGPSYEVNALAVSGADLYVGGAFTSYRTNSKGYYLARVSSSTGVLDTTTFNTVASSGPNAAVNALVLNGASLYVGGAFTSYRTNAKGFYVAKVDSGTGALDTTTFNTVASSGPNNTVHALALSGSSLYIGGAFTSYRADAKGFYIAKVSSTTGALDTATFNTTASSGPDDTVYSLLVSGSDLYIGGDFLEYRLDPKGFHLAKVSATTGVLDTTTFNAITASGPEQAIFAFAISGSNLYMGGEFVSYRGTPAQNLAKVSFATWKVDATFTQATGPNNYVQSMLLSGTSLYIGGNFWLYRGDNKADHIAKVDSTSGAMDTTNFNTIAWEGANDTVRTMIISGANLYIGGDFTSYRSDTKGYKIAKLNATTGVMDTGSFNTGASLGPNNDVHTLVFSSSGTSIFVGGSFTNYRGDTKGYHLAKVNATTGVMDTATFNTVASSGPDGTVYALVISGTSLFVGGDFESYRGDARGYYLSKVSGSTGVMDTGTFNTVATSGPDDQVHGLALSSDGLSLFVAGFFSGYRLNTFGREIAKVLVTTGVMETTSFNTAEGPSAGLYCVSLSTDGSRIFVGGDSQDYREDNSTPYFHPISSSMGSLSW